MKKNRILIAIFILLIAGTLTVALMKTQPLAKPVLAQEAQKAERIMVIAVEEVINGETFAGEVEIRFVNPAGLPETASDAFGLFLSKDDDTLTLGTGAIEVEVGVEVVNDEDPVNTINASNSGGEVEIVITDTTIIYFDTTQRPEVTPADIEAGEMIVQRSVQPGSLDDLGKNTIVQVWGTPQGGKIVADVLVIEQVQ